MRAFNVFHLKARLFLLEGSETAAQSGLLIDIIRNVTTRYYYDGQSIVADYTYNGSEAPAREYVNGTQYIDERAVMRNVAGGGQQEQDHYYLLKDLYTAAGLAYCF